MIVQAQATNFKEDDKLSAANFCTMRDFPLFAKDYNEDAKRCPECGAIMSADATECDFCECNELEDYQYYDKCAAYDERQEIEDKLLDFNRGLLFHEVKLQSGYYSGVQFYVEINYDLTEDQDYSNDDCHYYFDCCRSVAYRKYASEVRKINRKLVEFAKAYGFQEYVCTARFSNGEAWYQLASNPRARLKSVVA